MRELLRPARRPVFSCLGLSVGVRWVGTFLNQRFVLLKLL